MRTHIFEGCLLEQSGKRRLVIPGAQTDDDPVDPNVLDEDLEVRVDIDIRGRICVATGEQKRLWSLFEAPVPTLSVPVEKSDSVH